ncbi:MAG: transposase [Bacteroides sp.]|nr:transposase [Bacteroides sp.]
MSTAKVEGINNKIKVMKRNAYGFRDDRYLCLRFYALFTNAVSLEMPNEPNCHSINYRLIFHY